MNMNDNFLKEEKERVKKLYSKKHKKDLKTKMILPTGLLQSF